MVREQTTQGEHHRFAEPYLLLERQTLEEDFGPDGYNVGVNIGRAGGQTVMHVHWHVIPRYLGDHPHPQGGVRQIIPEKADYPRATTF